MRVRDSVWVCVEGERARKKSGGKKERCTTQPQSLFSSKREIYLTSRVLKMSLYVGSIFNRERERERERERREEARGRDKEISNEQSFIDISSGTESPSNAFAL
jgi:hypothetical protein